MDALHAFQDGPLFPRLTSAEQARMNLQAHYMARYSEILGERIAAAIPGARTYVVPGCGHTLPKEAPDEVSRQLLATIGMGDVRHAARYAEPPEDVVVCPVGSECADALDRMAGEGVHAVRVAVAGPEAPPALLERADLVLDGPQGVVALLRDLAAQAVRQS